MTEILPKISPEDTPGDLTPAAESSHIVGKRALSRLALTAALGGLAACAPTAQTAATADQPDPHYAEIARLQSDLDKCREKIPDLAAGGSVISEGTLGAFFIDSQNGKYIRLPATAAQSVEQYFVFWPPILNPAQIKLSGEGLTIVPYGKPSESGAQRYAVMYKTLNRPEKTALVIELKNPYVRYAVLIENIR